MIVAGHRFPTTVGIAMLAVFGIAAHAGLVALAARSRVFLALAAGITALLAVKFVWWKYRR